MKRRRTRKALDGPLCSNCFDAQGEQRSCLRAKIARWGLSRINVKLSYTSDRVGHEVCLLGRRLQPIGPTKRPSESYRVGRRAHSEGGGSPCQDKYSPELRERASGWSSTAPTSIPRSGPRSIRGREVGLHDRGAPTVGSAKPDVMPGRVLAWPLMNAHG